MKSSEYKSMISYQQDDGREPKIRIELEWLGSKFTQMVVQEFDNVKEKLAPAIAQAVASFDFEESAKRHASDLVDDAVRSLVISITDEMLREKNDELIEVVMERIRADSTKESANV